MAKIKTVQAREILASGGQPTLEVAVTTDSGVTGEAAVSFGASAGSHEAMVLLDNDPKRYHGGGMLIARENVKSKIAGALLGMDISGQREIDELMKELDGTENYSNLGGNAVLGVSMAAARAAAAEANLPLYKYLRESYKVLAPIKLPKPMMVMIEGGKHADNTTDLQEYCLSALGGRPARENVRMMMEIYGELKKILKKAGLSTNVGNEGAFAPNGIAGNEKPMEYLVEAIGNAGYEPGKDAGISIDAAASEFATVNSQSGITNYELRIENKTLNSKELIEYYLPWLNKYPIVSFEDMLAEDDWENWPVLTEKMGQIPNIGDDLTVTNVHRWQKAIEAKAASAILIKLNQAGTVTQTMDCCLMAMAYGLWTVPSHRGGGESNDTFLVDVAVATGSEYIKVGPTRGERVAKYNRLMRIEEELAGI